MSTTVQTIQGPRSHSSRHRRLLVGLAYFRMALLLFRAIGAEPYGVPTGSMAPALLGNHRAAVCPRCGCPFEIGVREDPAHADPISVFCPNCGFDEFKIAELPVCRGDHLLVNKSVFSLRRPRRWEMAVFRCPAEHGKVYVKRVIGLPGEAIQVQGGDLLIDHQLARKSLAEFKALRLPVFDQNYAPQPDGWQQRWETQPPHGPASLEGNRLRLQSLEGAEEYDWLVYRNYSLDLNKVLPLRDEYSYNGLDAHSGAEAVHDFMLECDLEVLKGAGWAAFGITDGLDELVAEVPVGKSEEGARLRECHFVQPTEGISRVRWEKTYRTAPTLKLSSGKSYHLELAFVDRRISLAIDGVPAFPPLDLPLEEERAEVIRPVRIGARGVELRIANFRLFRDVHYTAAGRHGVASPVRLRAGEYFVLGDNSPNSDDNRFWSDAAGEPMPVPEASFLGKPFLVHMPSHVVHWNAWGQQREYQGLDWGRIRWLR